MLQRLTDAGGSNNEIDELDELKISAFGKGPYSPAPDGKKARPLSIALVPGNPALVKLVREHDAVEAVNVMPGGDE